MPAAGLVLVLIGMWLLLRTLQGKLVGQILRRESPGGKWLGL